jgi:putative endonuclease
MFHIYIPQSEKDHRTYAGYTCDLEKRLLEHNGGKVDATRNRKPFKIIYTESFITEKEAKDRERYWKSGAGRRNLKKIFSGFPPHFKK